MGKHFGRWLFALAVLTVTIAGGTWGVKRAISWWEWASAPVEREFNATETRSRLVEIPPGTPAQAIGERLERQGIIRSDRAWRLWTLHATKVEKRSGGFQAGTYRLSPAQSLDEVAETIWTGNVVSDRFTIPEGWSLQQMANYFEEEGFFSAEEFLQAARDIPRDRYGWLPEELPHLEGFLFPDTYQLPRSSISPELAIEVMLDRFEEVALPIYRQGEPPLGLSLREWVTLASIVEKEAVIPSERQTIAGVFVERLRRGMRLETDPTVEYGLGIKQTKEQPLTLNQVRTPSPYNTYLNPGLPPTAIASPGRASLEAAFNPADTNYLFFVARYDGTHVFSETFQEHLAAQRRIQNRQ